MPPFQVLTEEQRAFFLEHGWLKIPDAIHKKYLDEWTKDLWIRLGWKEDDKDTWAEDYPKLPRHRDVDVTEFLKPDAWKIICDIVGGEDKIIPNRERMVGDQFIINVGTEYWQEHTIAPNETPGWHTDNDWYRQFLDSAGETLTVIHLFSDITPGGGGTLLCEDGISGVVKFLAQHPEGLDPPVLLETYEHIVDCKKFTEVTGKAGDTILLHQFLPHTNAKNHHRDLRIITNPHICLKEPYNLNREDKDYTPCEQVVLNALGSPDGTVFTPVRERKYYYPRTATFKSARAKDELERMAKAAGGLENVDSVWKLDKGSPEFRKFEENQGFGLPVGPGGLVHNYADYNLILETIDQYDEMSPEYQAFVKRDGFGDVCKLDKLDGIRTPEEGLH